MGEFVGDLELFALVADPLACGTVGRVLQPLGKGCGHAGITRA
jgi:hypothetical protein